MVFAAYQTYEMLEFAGPAGSKPESAYKFETFPPAFLIRLRSLRFLRHLPPGGRQGRCRTGATIQQLDKSQFDGWDEMWYTDPEGK